jgi:hypothetical protein
MAHPHRVILVKMIFEKIVDINQSLGIAILLVEQKCEPRAGNLALRLRARDRPNPLARPLERVPRKRARENRVIRRRLRPNCFRRSHRVGCSSRN